MVTSVDLSARPAATAVTAKDAPAPAVVPRPPAQAQDPAMASVVRVSEAGAEAARTAARTSAPTASSTSSADVRVPLDAVVAQADINQDGTVSDQERLTDAAHVAAQQALLQGGSNLEEALQAYQAIASMADAQR